MTTRAVDLVIRARQEADRAVNAVSAALRDLSRAQKEVQESSSGTDSSIGKLASTFRNLDRIVDQAGDKAARSFKQIEDAVDRASVALKKQKTDIADTRAAYKAVAGQIDGASAAVARLETALARAQNRRGTSGQFIGADQAAAEIARLQPQLAAAKAEFSNLTQQSDKLSASLTAQGHKVDRLDGEYTRLQGAAAAGQLAMREFGEGSAKTAEELTRAKEQLQRTGTAARSTGASMRQAATSGGRLRDAFRSIYGEGRSAMSFMQRLRGEVLALSGSMIGLYAIVNQVGQVISAVMSIEAIENRLGAVFNQDAQRVGQEMLWLEAQADRLGIEFGILGEQYAQYAIAADTAGFSSAGIRESFLGVAEAGRVMKLSNEQVQGTFYALIQMISKGKVQSEELRRQLGDRLPGAFQFMEQALGLATGQLDEMLDRGEVFADESTLVDFAAVLTDRFGDQLPAALLTTRTEIGRLENASLQARRTIAESGFEDAFKLGLRDLTAFLNSDNGQEGLARLGEGLARIMTTVGQLGSFATENFGSLVRVGQAFIALKLTTMFVGIGRAVGTGLTPQVRAATVQVRALSIWMGRTAATSSGALRTGLLTGAAALRSFRGVAVAASAALAGFGGLPGVLLTALTFLGTELVGRWAGGTNQATAALRQHERVLERVQRDYAEVGDDAEEFGNRLSASLNVSEMEVNLRDLQDKYNSTINSMWMTTNRFLNNIAATSPTLEQLGFSNQLRAATQALRDGEISAQQFRERVDELQQAGANFSDRFVQRIQDLASGTDEGAVGANELRDAIEELQAELRLAAGTATDADRALLGLGSSLDDVSESLETSRIRRYTEALRELRDAVPDLKRMDRFQEQLASLGTSRTTALETADPGHEAEINATFDRARVNLERDLIDSVDYSGIIDRTAGGGADAEVRRAAEENLRRIARQLLDAGADVSQENVLAVNLGAQPSDIAAGGGGEQISQAQSTLGISDTEVARAREAAEERRKLAEAQAEFNLALVESNSRAAYALSIAEETGNEQEVLLAIFDAQQEARNRGIQFGETQRGQIRSRIDAERELAAIETVRQKIAEDHDEKQNAQDMVDLLTERAQLLRDQIEFSREIGDNTQAALLLENLIETNDQLREAIPAAIAFWEAMGGPESEQAILRLQGVRQQLAAAESDAIVTAREINDSIANGAGDAFDQFSDSLANGENAINSLGDAFRAFASDFLRQIARMIFQQMILNLLQSAMGGGKGGVGGVIANAVNSVAGVHHDGGIIGAASTSRSVPSAYFANAMKYHTGGIIGLKPDERPIIGKVGEEMLTENDPRHRNNASGQTPVKIINAIDAGDFVSKGMDTKSGERAILNFIRANSDAVKGALA
jgi:tape measure domain-containing protein